MKAVTDCFFMRSNWVLRASSAAAWYSIASTSTSAPPHRGRAEAIEVRLGGKAAGTAVRGATVPGEERVEAEETAPCARWRAELPAPAANESFV